MKVNFLLGLRRDLLLAAEQYKQDRHFYRNLLSVAKLIEKRVPRDAITDPQRPRRGRNKPGN